MSFVERQKLLVLFRLGIADSFERVLARAKCILTTSVKEGFGLAFLESWMGERMLFGRLLPEICVDFTERGMVLEHLYREISIPHNLFNLELFGRKWIKCYRERLRLYGLETDRPGEQAYMHKIKKSGRVDLGMLSEDLQRQVIENVRESCRYREELLELNPPLRSLCQFSRAARCGSGGKTENPLLQAETISHNRDVVSREFSVERNRERLLHVYDRVAGVDPVHTVDGTAILRRFNTPASNYLLLCDQSYDK
jgi:hypothetical protein